MTEEKTIFDFRKLKGRIVEKYGSQTAFVVAFGGSEVAFSRKMNNVFRFSTDDIIKIINLLGIPVAEIGEYFFTVAV